MSRAGSKTVTDAHVDLSNQVMPVLKSRYHAATVARFLYEVNALCEVLANDVLPDPERDDLLVRVQGYVDFFSECQKNWANVTYGEQDKLYLSSISKNLKKLPENSASEFAGFFSIVGTIVVDEAPIPVVPSVAKTANYRPAPAAEATSDFNAVLDQARQWGRSDQELKKPLSLDDEGYQLFGYYPHLRVLRFVESHFSGQLTPAHLRQLLNIPYGYGDEYQPHWIRTAFSASERLSPNTVYPYLRFALIGPAKTRVSNELIVPGGNSSDLSVQEFTRRGASSTEFLSVILEDKSLSSRIPPAVLICALLGGYGTESNMAQGEYMGVTQQRKVDPLIFGFLKTTGNWDLIWRNIYIEPANPRYWNKEKGDEALLGLISYLFKNAARDETTIAASFYDFAVSEVKRMKDISLLKKLYAMYSDLSKMRSEKLLLEGRPVAALLQIGMFSGAPAADRSADINAKKLDELKSKVDAQLKNLYEKLGSDSKVDDVELHSHKVAVLVAAKKLLNGEVVDFDSVKKENHRYSEGFLSHATKDLVTEIESIVKKRGSTSDLVSSPNLPLTRRI